ncbi:hypothetical protein ABFX02_13G016800 [Erythranthe guttata]
MSDTKEVEFTLKVMINKQKTKVLFAEIDSLPTITNLYNGLANLDIDHFETEAAKEMLLDPVSAFDAERLRTREDGDNGVFTINTVSFLISDDLVMVPNVALPTVQTLRNLVITNIDGACFSDGRPSLLPNHCSRDDRPILCLVLGRPSEGYRSLTVLGTVVRFLYLFFGRPSEVCHQSLVWGRPSRELMNVTFGFNEGSLLSRAPLTDIILDKSEGSSTKPNFEPEILLSHEKEKEANFSSKILLLKLIGQRSTNKLMFAQGDEAIIDFLFRLLTIPPGGVERLLGGNTCLRSIDNLYRSVTNLIDDKYLATPDIKTVWLTYSDFGNQPVAIYAQGDQNYVNFVKGQKMCMVSDDLTVTPSSMSSSLSILNEMNIKLSDVETMEMQIGLHEGLSILKASLTSASALTDALKINDMIKKQPKQEH